MKSAPRRSCPRDLGAGDADLTYVGARPDAQADSARSNYAAACVNSPYGKFGGISSIRVAAMVRASCRERHRPVVAWPDRRRRHAPVGMRREMAAAFLGLDGKPLGARRWLESEIHRDRRRNGLRSA